MGAMFRLDTPCTAGARSAIDWSERVKTENRLVVDALRIGSKESSNCTFILIWRHQRQFDDFQSFKKCVKRWSKTGSLNVKILFLKGLIGGSTFEIRKIDVLKRHLLRALKPPPYPIPKNQFFRRRNEEEHDFDQSNFGTSNVRALRAINQK